MTESLQNVNEKLKKSKQKKEELKKNITGISDLDTVKENSIPSRFYKEYKEAAHQLQLQYQRRTSLATNATALKLRVAKELYGNDTSSSAYDEWERTHDPGNRLETIISNDFPSSGQKTDDNSNVPEYRRLAPMVCVVLLGKDSEKPTSCLLTSVNITCGSCPPLEVAISVFDSDENNFVSVGTYPLKDTQQVQTISLGGESDKAVADALTRASMVKLQFKGNHRGGNISALRHIDINGVESIKLLSDFAEASVAPTPAANTPKMLSERTRSSNSSRSELY